MKLKKMIAAGLALSVMTSVSFANHTSDAGITSAVQNKISSDASLQGANIAIKTSNGVVNLSGKVESNTQADTATELAQSTPGVTDVDTSKLSTTDSQHPLDDSAITAKVKGMFIQKKLFSNTDISAMTISVETNNGVVSLSGTAESEQQINNAINITRSVKGVKSVNSTIKISQ
jgi:hyperosmotically inducible protein